MTRDEWIAAFAAELEVEPPDAATVEMLLDLAGTAAHASERTAAPIACYLVGLSGAAPAIAGQVAAGVAPAAAGDDDGGDDDEGGG
ncbi:MAG: hypothetical protein JXA83_09435 [Acidimicrobiales bacterium]|nr:hypothetical protein [Acidimicrobiales bacterium]